VKEMVKKRKRESSSNTSTTIVFSLLLGLIAGGITASFVTDYKLSQVSFDEEKTWEELVKEYYQVENAVLVSPHGLRKHLGEETNTILVDLRSSEEYNTAHITGAVNIPAYATPDKSDYGAVERIVGSFKQLKVANPDKEIIVYCYSGPCMTGRKIGKMLTEHGIYVKHLGIGWSEWRYYWNMWNHDGETAVNPEAYMSSGPEPGTFEIDLVGKGCPIEGTFGC
jgi:rhodanese-related sulfurtransferase